jgi:hypothetical protein
MLKRFGELMAIMEYITNAYRLHKTSCPSVPGEFVAN